MSTPGDSLMLQLIEGPDTGQVATRWRVDQTSPLILGRGQEARIQLPDASISRRHAEIGFDGVDWIVRDLGSRHGTQVNERPVPSGSETPLRHRDVLRLGPWVFRTLISGGATGGMTLSTDDEPAGRVRRILPGEMGTLVRRRLDLVLGAAEALGDATSEGAIAKTVVDTVLAGAGSSRAALVRIDTKGEPGDLLASGGDNAEEGVVLSRSLIREAAKGATVLLESDAPTHAYGQSIVDLGIHSAFCAPVKVGQRVDAVLYLDARGTEVSAPNDAVAFVSAMARICGLSLSNLNRAALERQRAQLEADLSAARVAQRIMMPASDGQIGSVRFGVVSRPGRFVAGDLVGIEPRADGRLCFYVGDVTGKGAGAAMVMGIAQSYLCAALSGGADILDAVTRLNRMLSPRMELGQFISLWIGEFDPVTRMLRSVDAGHGYALSRDPRGQVRNQASAGGLPLGIEPNEIYESASEVMEPGSTVLVYSDGLVEQNGLGNDQFGVNRVRQLLAEHHEPNPLLQTLVARLIDHAGVDRFDDDLTMAAFLLG